MCSFVKRRADYVSEKTSGIQGTYRPVTLSYFQLIINSHLTDNWQMAQNLTDNWQMDEILTDKWHLYPPIQTLI